MGCACAIKMMGTSPQTNTSNLTACDNDVAHISLQKVLNKNRYLPLEGANKFKHFYRYFRIRVRRILSYVLAGYLGLDRWKL